MVIQRISLLALSLFALAPMLRADSVDDSNRRAAFSSSFEFFYGPQWFRNALSNPAANRGRILSRLSYDASGDRAIEAAYVGTLRNEFNADAGSFSSPFYRTTSSALISPSAPSAPVVPANRLWIGTGGAISWSNNANWNPADSPNTATELAQFGSATNSTNTVGIDGTSRTAGGIEMLSNRTAGMTIGASGTTSPAGTGLDVTLAGVTINGVDNTILRNNSSFDLVLQPSVSTGTNVMRITLGNTTDNVVNIDSTGNIIIGTAITGSGRNLTLNATSTGTLRFDGGAAANTYSGLTAVNSGTLILNKADGVNAIAGDVRIGNGTPGGTAAVRLGQSNQISNTSSVELAGGTFRLNGFSEGAPGTNGVGALTLTATSTIDFAVGVTSSIIQFAGLGAHTLGTGPDLLLTNWDGTAGTGGGPERLLFAGSVMDFTSQYAQSDVFFNGIAGYDAAQFTGYYEIFAPVPEPSTWIGAGLALAVIGFTQRRKLRGLIARA